MFIMKIDINKYLLIIPISINHYYNTYYQEYIIKREGECPTPV